ncbi:WRKY transcription factor [Actinidia chinensis var. chinensis]|uniref:WRKY transcription factor n=1 Tax=Actinidia chinensis var. chinensis TaxID=1590841 RepID=A0A2R6REZ1_ACTCC|nr:WRKY transcription factor [Actinidia chinensis var. chinensis]
MENDQAIFPCSSSTPPASHLSLNMVNSHAYNDSFQGDKADGYFNMGGPNFSDFSQSQSFVGTESTNEVKSDKKKGEKKVKNPKYAFQTRSQVDILDDGYRWRKYGQKAVKNNKFPRSYYRCTHQGCHVKKQVQRLAKDEGVVVTTYEGMHSHPIHKSNDNFEHILTQMQIYTAQNL